MSGFNIPKPIKVILFPISLIFKIKDKIKEKVKRSDKSIKEEG